jgi:hypothetical protein
MSNGAPESMPCWWPFRWWPFGRWERAPRTERKRTELNVIRTGYFLLTATILGAIAALVYGWTEHSWMLAITGFLIAGAAYAVAWLVGFLFGIPRSRAEESQATAAVPAAGGAAATGAAAVATASTARASSGLRTNTNLQDVSDWLTKLLLGAGLTQLNYIPSLLGRFGHNAAVALLGSGADPDLHSPISVFVQALTVYFAAVGFLSGYLVTRLFLAGAFSDADKELNELRDELQTAHQKAEGAEARIENLQLLAAPPSAPEQKAVPAEGGGPAQPQPSSREKLEPLVRQYNELRNTPWGPERTRKMTAVFRQMIDVVKGDPEFNAVQYFDHADRGWRLVGYAAAYANPQSRLLEPLVRSLIKYSSRTAGDGDNRAFGEYWGIETLDRVLSVALPGPEIIRQLRDWAVTIPKGTDRWAAMSRILRRHGVELS